MRREKREKETREVCNRDVMEERRIKKQCENKMLKVMKEGNEEGK